IETAQVIWPSGAATAGVAPMAEIRRTSVTAKTTRTVLMASASTAGHVNSGQFRHLPLRLLQPVPHPHLAVHRRCGGEVLLRLLTLASAPVELAEAEVAVGDEGAHAEFGRDNERRPVVAFGISRLGGLAQRRHVAEELAGPRLEAEFAALPREVQ